MIKENEVYTRVRNALKTEFGSDINVVKEYVATPSKFPCVSIIETSHVPVTRYEDMSASDGQYRSTYDINAYSNLTSGGTTQVKKMINCVIGEFKTMGYRVNVNEPIPNADISFKRHVARVTRIIGDSDTLPILTE